MQRETQIDMPITKMDQAASFLMKENNLSACVLTRGRKTSAFVCEYTQKGSSVKDCHPSTVCDSKSLAHKLSYTKTHINPLVISIQAAFTQKKNRFIDRQVNA